MARSDWMKMEQERGISVTTSVMQFPYRDCVINLLDTPGHEDFSEDTYRTLTAVDSAVMIIDAARGVEPRTRKLLSICRMRNTPILTFINKLDREAQDPLDLLAEIEEELEIDCVAKTWPIGSGQRFRGTYDFESDSIQVFERGHAATIHEFDRVAGLESDEARSLLGEQHSQLCDEIELLQGAGHEFDRDRYLHGLQTPVLFGTALQNFGINELLDTFVEIAPSPKPRETITEPVPPEATAFSGFVFKIQANMDPKHRDRIAFLRVCSGKYSRGMRVRHVRLDRDVKIPDAVTFMAGARTSASEAFAGDIIGIHNHGTIQIGDSFSNDKPLTFLGIPNFAPELFRRTRIKDPLKAKKLNLGIQQLSEEGATQVFFPLRGNDVIVGAVGSLQFDLVAFRLAQEYNADCVYESCNVFTVRWVSSEKSEKLEEFKTRTASQLAFDGGGQLAFLATSRANLELNQERWPDIRFRDTREHRVG